jgi:hypothetical protein
MSILCSDTTVILYLFHHTYLFFDADRGIHQFVHIIRWLVIVPGTRQCRSRPNIVTLSACSLRGIFHVFSVLQVGAYEEHQITVQILCDESVFPGAKVVNVSLVAPYVTNIHMRICILAVSILARRLNPSFGICSCRCRSLAVMKSRAACGCRPDCAQRNCGLDGCGGYCGAPFAAGECPYQSKCVDGVCCKGDCNGRSCGDDGCGNSCGECAAGSFCSAIRTCVNPSVVPTLAPSQFPAVFRSTTPGSDVFAAYLGGVIAAIFVGIAVQFCMQFKQSGATSVLAAPITYCRRRLCKR